MESDVHIRVPADAFNLNKEHNNLHVRAPLYVYIRAGQFYERVIPENRNMKKSAIN